MRVLVDTVIWIDHLRSEDRHLVSLLSEDRVVVHDHIIGELAMGSLKNRRNFLSSLLDLRSAPLAEENEVRDFIEAHRLFALGIGYSDAHLLVSAALDGGLLLWTRDSRLAAVAEGRGVGYREA